ncbi:uncharacterized protein LOC135206201 [Macrobrachium nipponense]|uniref:uncharacterized protein LOC135206201 n=1 Tax=Macrobrachium nipponense TaxID=159736 RepID=UPI0030C7C5BC
MNHGRLLLLFLIQALSWRTGTAEKNMDLGDATSWATYAWAEPWKGVLGTYTIQPRNDEVQTRDIKGEEAPTQEIPKKQPQKRHYVHYIPLTNPEGLERPRKQHFGGEEGPIYDTWEQAPLLAKEGLTSEEALWVPVGQPLQVIKQGYSWGSQAFDQSFQKQPRLAVETHLAYEHPFPPSSYLPTTRLPRSQPLPPTTVSTPAPEPSLIATLLPSTTPYSKDTYEPEHKIAKPHPTVGYHPHLPPLYHSAPHYPIPPRKYYLTDESPLKYKHGYALRKYILNTEPTVTHSDPGDVVVKAADVTANEIETPSDMTDDTTSTTLSASEENSNSGFKHEDVPKSPPAHKYRPHVTYSPPYSHSLHLHPYPPVHSNYNPPPYGHYLHQRPPYPTNDVYYPTPGTIRKYLLNTSPSSSPEDSQPDTGDDQGKPDLSTFDIYEMLRMPRSTGTSWQSVQYGPSSTVTR